MALTVGDIIELKASPSNEGAQGLHVVRAISGSSYLVSRPDNPSHLISISATDVVGGYSPPALTAAATVGKVAAAIASQVAITTPNDGVVHHYRVSVVTTITTLGSGSINAEVAYTDDGGSAHANKIIPVAMDSGAYAAAANAAGCWGGQMVIACNPNTAVTIFTAGTFTGCTYNFWGAVEKLD